MSPDINKALEEGTDASGGYLVPDEISRRILEYIQDKAVALQVCRQVTMKSDVLKIPKVTGGTTGYWVPENIKITSSDMTFGQVTLTAKKVAALSKFSSELKEDSITDVWELIADQMAKDLALKIDDEIFNGTGGQFTNYMRNSSISGINTVDAGANGDDMSLSKITAAVYECTVDNHIPTDIIAHPVITKKLRNLTDSTGRPLLDAATYGSPLLKDGVVGTVYGLKYRESNQLPTNLTKGTGTALTDILVVKAMNCGWFGIRRKLTVHKDYDIEYDQYIIQSNLRCAFNIPYPKAICIIKDIKTT